jgi:hypothetical protein
VLTVDNVTAMVGGNGVISATLRGVNDEPLVGQPVVFSYLGQAYPSTTNGAGTAQTGVPDLTTAGVRSFTAFFAGNNNYNGIGPVSASITWQQLDTTPPVISLTTPADNATYLLGQVVLADYACTDEADGSGLASCEATVAPGSAINTATAGAKSFTVDAADNAANLATVTHHYTVSKLAQTIDFTAPATHGRQDGNFTITASASSALTVSFTSSTTAVCTVTDHGDGTATVSNLSVGDCVVVASQAGNANYTATAPVERTIQIVQGGGEIGFCTPGYWQGGAGSQRWNVANDPGWGGFHAQPYTHASAFFGRTNPYTSPFSRNRIPTADIPNSMTMFDIVSTGGSSNSAQRAARSVIAAYLNASSKQEGAGYPLTSAVIVSRWNTAANISNAAQRDAALDALHLELDAHNNGFDCR